MVIYDILSIVFHEAFCTEKFSLHNGNLPKKNYIYIGKQTYGVWSPSWRIIGHLQGLGQSLQARAVNAVLPAGRKKKKKMEKLCTETSEFFEFLVGNILMKV